MGNVYRYAQTAVPALLWTLLAPASAAGHDDMAGTACPGAFAWMQAHPEESETARRQRDAARTFSEPALAAELNERFKRDQDARNALLASPNQPFLMLHVAEIDADDVVWLNRLVRRQDFPTAAQVGELGVRQAWLLAQHADKQPQFQADLLPALEARYAAGEIDGTTLSRFVDRVLKAQGKPQRYGTQFTREEWASSQVPMPDEARLRVFDANRLAFRIMPLADYVCMMRIGRTKR